MLKEVKQITNELRMIYDTRYQWRSIQNMGKSKTLFIIGNGPSVQRLDVTKVANLLPPEKADIAFVNGFLHEPPFSIERYNCLYFIADPLIYKLIKWLVEGGNRDELRKREVIEALFPDVGLQARHSLLFDANSILNALEANNIKWFCPHHFTEALAQLGVTNFFSISRFTLPNSWPLIITKLLFKIGAAKPNIINPLGPAVVNWAILSGIMLGYKDIIIIGHHDEWNWTSYFMKDDSVHFKYKYFWESEDRVYRRTDTWRQFTDAQYKLIQIERCLSRNVKTPVRYITPSHLHLHLTDPAAPDLLKLTE